MKFNNRAAPRDVITDEIVRASMRTGGIPVHEEADRKHVIIPEDGVKINRGTIFLDGVTPGARVVNCLDLSTNKWETMIFDHSNSVDGLYMDLIRFFDNTHVILQMNYFGKWKPYILSDGAGDKFDEKGFIKDNAITKQVKTMEISGVHWIKIRGVDCYGVILQNQLLGASVATFAPGTSDFESIDFLTKVKQELHETREARKVVVDMMTAPNRLAPLPTIHGSLDITRFYRIRLGDAA